MPRRRHEDSAPYDDEPPKKKSFDGTTNNTHFKQGEIITDISGKCWKLGKTIGVGGFGEIYEASDTISKRGKTDNYYVAKVEKHTSGPLFVEINCYLRIAKLEMIEEWNRKTKMNFLGMPHYVASGSCYHNNEKYRFLLLPKYKKDLGQILQEKRVFNIKTVCNICIQILNVLEYIHTQGYVHSDIKASNIMLNDQIKSKKKVDIYCKPIRNRKCRYQTGIRKSLRSKAKINYSDDISYLEEVLDTIDNPTEQIDENIPLSQVYLVDFGLVSKYLMSNGEHKEFCVDNRRAHAGTILFSSRDAHKGIPSRRSDLESLAYNMIYWLTGALPWIEDIEDPVEVEKKKNRCFNHLKQFLDLCFNNDFPSFILDYFEYLDKLQFEEDPSYDYCRNIFKKAIKAYGYENNSVLDFNNVEGWGNKQKKQRSKSYKMITNYCSFLNSSPLKPLPSNIVFKRPKLRKKIKNKKEQDSMMNWSKILLLDPETIIKQSRERKVTEDSDSEHTNMFSLDIESLNPTSAMLDIYNKFMERNNSPRYKDDSINYENIEGYTHAMMKVYLKKHEREELEKNILNTQQNGCYKRKKKKSTKRSECLKSSESPEDGIPRRKGRFARRPKNTITFKRTYRLRG